MVDISVVIPTRNRPALLGRCLGLLCEQTLDPARYEICVVNNGEANAAAKVVELVAAHYPRHRVILVHETRTGVAYARNTGIEATTAPLVVQGDDDIFVPADWLEKFMAAFASGDPKIGKIGGDVTPLWGAPRPAWLSDALLPLLTAASGFGDAPRFVEEGLLECNCCYRREAIAAAGNFPTTLGGKGNSLLSTEHAVDLVMHTAGWKLFYEPSIVVQHNIHAERLTPVWFRRRYFWQGVSDFAIYDYLKTKGIQARAAIAVDMPFDRADWAFINNSVEPPTEEGLRRLRGLGFILARSGFIPVD